MSKFRVSYAQNREDIILSGFFDDQKKGFYVDVGANHPDTLSVTKYFYDRGWNGINIEPNKDLFNEIVAQRDRDINLNVGASDKPGNLILRQYPEGDGLSTFSTETQKNYQKMGSEYKQYTDSYEDHKVEVKTLKQIFDENKVNIINFLNIDVEGYEYEVIAGNDWKKYRPQVICIEANHIVKDWRPIIEEANYELIFFDGLNNYYVDSSQQQIIENFSYVKAVLLGKPVIPYYVNDELQVLTRSRSQMEEHIIRQDFVDQDLREIIRNLQMQIESNKRFRALVKQLLFSVHNIILLNIEKLNRPRTLKQPPLEFDEQSIDAEELIKIIREYDNKRYYNSASKPPLFYKILSAFYLGVFKTMRYVVRKLFSIARSK